MKKTFFGLAIAACLAVCAMAGTAIASPDSPAVQAYTQTTPQATPHAMASSDAPASVAVFKSTEGVGLSGKVAAVATLNRPDSAARYGRYTGTHPSATTPATTPVSRL